MPGPARLSVSTARGSGVVTDGAQNTGPHSSRKINIDINGLDGSVATFSVPVNLPMHRLLKRYCQIKFLDYQGMDLLYNGERVQLRRTVDELQLVEGDEIDAVVTQVRAGFPGRDDAVRRLTLDIGGPDGYIVTYSIPANLALERLLRKYCTLRNLEYQTMDFIDQRGNPIEVTRTADELHMVEGEHINAYHVAAG